MPQPSLWEALLEISCWVWQLQQIRGEPTKEGSSVWATAFQYGPLLCIHIAPCSCVSAGQEKHLTWHLEMLKDSLPGPEGGGERTNDAFADTCFKGQEGGSATEFGPVDPKRPARPLFLRRSEGSREALSEMVSSLLDQTWSLGAYGTIFLDCTLGSLSSWEESHKEENAF